MTIEKTIVFLVEEQGATHQQLTGVFLRAYGRASTHRGGIGVGGADGGGKVYPLLELNRQLEEEGSMLLSSEKEFHFEFELMDEVGKNGKGGERYMAETYKGVQVMVEYKVNNVGTAAASATTTTVTAVESKTDAAATALQIKKLML